MLLSGLLGRCSLFGNGAVPASFEALVALMSQGKHGVRSLPVRASGTLQPAFVLRFSAFVKLRYHCASFKTSCVGMDFLAA